MRRDALIYFFVFTSPIGQPDSELHEPVVIPGVKRSDELNSALPPAAITYFYYVDRQKAKKKWSVSRIDAATRRFRLFAKKIKQLDGLSNVRVHDTLDGCPFLRQQTAGPARRGRWFVNFRGSIIAIFARHPLVSGVIGTGPK
jgi:hypothetical protein